MSKTKTIELLQFNELTEEQKQKVLDNYRYYNVEDITLTEDGDYKEFIEGQGFNSPDIYYDLSYCQGCGACFDCNSFDIKRLLEGYNGRHKRIMIDIINYYFEMAIEKNSYATYYDHENTRTFVFYDHMPRDYKRILEEITNIEQFIERKRKDLSIELYNRLQKEYDYLISDEAVSETLIDNGYYFNTETYRIDY